MSHGDEPANSLTEMGAQWGWDQGPETETRECAQDDTRLANKVAEPQSAVLVLHLPTHTLS